MGIQFVYRSLYGEAETMTVVLSPDAI
jgi:hypothetical protein